MRQKVYKNKKIRAIPTENKHHSIIVSQIKHVHKDTIYFQFVINKKQNVHLCI